MKKNSSGKHFFSDTIIRFLAFFMGTLILYSTAQIVMEHFFLDDIKEQNAIVARQQAKRKIGSQIKERIILLDLDFQKNLVSDNKFARGRLFKQGQMLISSLNDLLSVLQYGGTYSHAIVVNLNTKDEVLEHIRYDKINLTDHRGNPASTSFFQSPSDVTTSDVTPDETESILKSSADIVVEAIDILPKIDELKSILTQIHSTQTQMESHSTEGSGLSHTVRLASLESLKKSLQLLVLQADTLLLRCRESSSKIFFDTTQELEKLTNAREALLSRIDSIRKNFYFILQAVITIMFLLIFIRISKLLKKGAAADEENRKLMAEIKDSNAVLEEIFTNLPVGIVLISSEKKVIQINPEAEKILEYTSGEGNAYLKNKVCHNNFCTLKESECPIYDLNKPNVILKERNAIRKDGSKVTILKSVIPIKLQGEEVLLEAFMDLSKIKQAELAIVGAKNAAEEASRAKSEFLANMSHEIRTPMNAIIGFSEILLTTEKNPTSRKQLSMIFDSAHILLNLINEILDFSKIEAGKIQIYKKPFSLNQLMNQMSSTFFISATEKKLTLDVTIDEGLPEYVLGDELRLRQVLINLTGNALKFTHHGGIAIHARYEAPNTIISVRDTGIGISEKSIRAIFNTFEQADSSTEKKYGGSGLGLSISLSLVRLMGGDISVESREGKGSCFTVTLPMEIADNVQGQNESMDAGVHDVTPKILIRPLKFLVVEDNRINTILAEAHLKKIKIESDCAENGKIALEMMQHTRYDLVLLDMHMPVMNGLDTLKVMKADPALADIPVIAQTADAIIGHDEMYLNAGCRAYLSKPTSHKALEAMIHDLLPDAFVTQKYQN